MINIESISYRYFCNLEPVPLPLKKGGELLIYPVKVKDYLVYQWAKEVMTINKNSNACIEQIKMSYLEFLQKVKCTTEETKAQMWNFLHLILHEDKFSFGNNCLIILGDNNEIKYVMKAKEFDDMRRIALYYNDVDYDDTYVSEDIQKLAEVYYETKFKSSNIEAPSLEKMKAFYCAKMGTRFSEINDIPFREFIQVYNALKDEDLFFSERMIQCSEKFDYKDNLIHPLFRPKKSPYADLFDDASILSQKGIAGAENINF